MLTNVSRPSAVDVLRPFAVGDQFYADTTSTLAKRAIGSANDVYTVTGGVPVWSSSITLTSLTVTDSGFFIVGNGDPTKRITFQADTQGAGFTFTEDVGAQTASRTATYPVLTGNSIYALSNTTLTSGRVPYATTNGILTDSSELTFSGTLLTLGTGSTAVISKTTGTTLTVSSTQAATSPTTGCATFGGGIGVGGGFIVGGDSYLQRSVATTTFYLQNSATGTTSSDGAFFQMASLVCNIGSFENGALQFWTNSQNRGAFAAGGDFSIASTTDSTTKDTGSIVTEGGIGVEKAIVTGTSVTVGTTLTVSGTTDATSKTTGAGIVAGGIGVTKNVISGQNQCSGATSTATAAGTTTLTSASTKVQIFTGTTTQTINFPAANVFGAGIAVEFIVINRSTGTVTPTRAGSDTFVGGGTTDPITTLNQAYYVSDGVSVWYKLAV